MAHWKMNDNEPDANVIDNIGSHDGVWFNANTSASSVTGKINQALSFDGATDYIAVPDSPIFNLTTFTFALWVRFDGLTTEWNRIVSKKIENTDPDGYEITLWEGADSHLYVAGSNDPPNVDIDCGTSWIGTGWHHLVVIYNNTNITVWFDGQNKGSGTIDAAIANTHPLNFGIVTAEVGLNMWYGLMDDIRYYDGILSDSQIAAIYNGGNGTEEDNP